MAKQGSLYTGFIKGRARAIKLGPNNPALDSSRAEIQAQLALRAHLTKGTKPAPQLSGPRQRVALKRGTKTAGATRIKGGVV